MWWINRKFLFSERKGLSNDAEITSKSQEKKGEVKSDTNGNSNRKEKNLASEKHANKARHSESNQSMEECDSHDEDSDNCEYEDISETSSTASKNESQSDSMGKLINYLLFNQFIISFIKIIVTISI